jgi:hypothetical protein
VTRSKGRAVAARSGRRGTDFVFDTRLAERGPTGMWPHLFLTPEASRWLGRRGTVNVIVNVNGVSFGRTAKPDGRGGHFILFNADMRERSGVEPGERVRVALEVDHAPRAVEPPRELERALRDDIPASNAYQAMPPSHRKAYVEFIEEAKRPETRVRRVQQALRMMAQWGAEHAERLRTPRPARGARPARSRGPARSARSEPGSARAAGPARASGSARPARSTRKR